MTDKKELVIFIGPVGGGKTYMANRAIFEGGKEHVKISLADPLRKICFDSLNYFPKDLKAYDKFKKSNVILKYSKTIAGFILLDDKVGCGTGRTILQNLSRTIKDLFGEEIFANLWYDAILKSNTNVITDDCRFDFEVKKALSLTRKGYNVRFIWRCYPDNDYTDYLKIKHESEKLSHFMYENADKYGLIDCQGISNSKMKQILKDFDGRPEEKPFTGSIEK